MRCSDFAFARFRFLRRVLLVHGHWYYWRVATLVQHFFYKNIVFITPAVFFSIFSAYSTQVRTSPLWLTVNGYPQPFKYRYLRSVRCAAAHLRHVLPHLLQPGLYVMAGADLRPAGAELYGAPAARQFAPVPRHRRQQPHELDPVLEVSMPHLKAINIHMIRTKGWNKAHYC